MRSIKSPIVVWAVALFFGFPLVGELIVWSSFQVFGVSWDQSGTPAWNVTNGLRLTSFVLYVVSYLFVRRLEHRILSRLWLYAIITSAIAVVSAPDLAPFDLFAVGMHRWVFAISILIAIAWVVVLVWFARGVSAISFGHSLLFIGLVAAVESPGTFIPLKFLYPSFVSAPSTPVFAALAVVHVIVSAIGVWSLVNCTALASSARNLLTVVALFVLLGGLQIGVSVAFSNPSYQTPLLLNTLIGIGERVVRYGVPSLIVYAVRIREPAKSQVGLKV